MVQQLTATEAVRDVIRKRVAELERTVKGGPEEGLVIVERDALMAFLDEPPPPASEYAAEVHTPARVIVSAECPTCHEVAAVALHISPELRVDEHGATLRLHGKSKPAPHVCGQTTFDLSNGQESFELSDIVGNDDSPDSDATNG